MVRVKEQPTQRAVMLGQYIIENRATVRSAAKKFGISKSTVHKDVSERLKKENPMLYKDVKNILEINKQERHIRGGLATKRKYSEIAERRKKTGTAITTAVPYLYKTALFPYNRSWAAPVPQRHQPMYRDIAV